MEPKGLYIFNFIESEKMADVIVGSSDVIRIKIGEWDFGGNGLFFQNDGYYCTVIETLKGAVKIDSEIVMIFFYNTVKPGQEYIVAVMEMEPDTNWYIFTSRNSLFRLDQKEEIMEYIK